MLLAVLAEQRLVGDLWYSRQQPIISQLLSSHPSCTCTSDCIHVASRIHVHMYIRVFHSDLPLVSSLSGTGLLMKQALRVCRWPRTLMAVHGTVGHASQCVGDTLMLD